MALNWFQGSPGITAPQHPVVIESIDREALFGPAEYEADPALKDAVNTALLLGQPLLLSGEPGTGKTQLAEKLALELGLELFKFETKSASVAQDLYYTFDHVARFQAAHTSSADGGRPDPLQFIDYGPIGRAIVNSLDADAARRLFPSRGLPLWFNGPRRSVVLIDEIDKAPSDFPNDVLNEVERHFFRIREVDGGLTVAAARNIRPVLVVTSNSERQLPDAFLRRCIFHHIQPISQERLERIVLRRLASVGVRSGPLLEDTLALFFALRSEAYDLRKRPSTAEYLSFVAAVFADAGAERNRRLDATLACRHVATLVKSPDDLAAALQHPQFIPAR